MKNSLKNYKVRYTMAGNMIWAIIILLAVFGVIAGIFGLVGFNRSFRREYLSSTRHMAETAATMVNGNHLDAYLAGEEKEEYLETKKRMDVYCRTMAVSLIYVIQVDRSDYGRFVSIFNSVNNAVDNSSYTEWELGHRRDTTNDEYREKYRKLYEGGSSCETVFRMNTTDGQNPHITTLIPVRYSSGDVAAILCLQRPISELEAAVKPYLLNIAVATVILAALSAVFAASYIKSHFGDPIQRVSREAARFARENTKGEPLGNISRYEEIAGLAAAIDKMEADMVRYMDNLTTVTAEKERIVTELSLAASIQKDSVPNEFPAFPDRTEFDIYASMTPAKEVGGDFYNFFLIDEDHLALLIGDVSGKGIPAALLMMVTNVAFTFRTRMGGSPAEILTAVNNNHTEYNNSDMFVTLWLGILEIPTGKVIAANAGHEDPAIYRKDGSFELFRTKHGFVAGVMPDIRYTDYEFRLGKGDKLFIYTDGVPEATDKDEKMFSLQRMLDALNECSQGSPEEILGNVKKRVDEFVGDAPQFDDLTMLCLEIRE